MTDSEIHVAMPDAPLPIALPSGWTVAQEADPLIVVGPEGDLKLSFFTAPADGSAEEQVRRAWREFDEKFDAPIRQQAEMPSTDGWDKVLQIVYDLPPSEGRIAMAFVRMLGSRVYINLLDGTLAAVSRRGAQVTEIVRLWKPAGLREPSLAGIEPKIFGERERQALSEFIRSAMQQLRIPGVAIAIVQNGDTVYAEGFGVRKVGGDHPVTPSTRFMIGSTTKPLTSLMMAKLADMGRFAWTTPVAQVLPGFALADADITRKLEMRHTVSASTGMPRRDMDLLFRFRGVRAEDRIAEMKSMLPTTGFGETFQYSNYLVAAGGYAAAHGFLPESPLGDAYESAMSELVFAPLGMKNTSVLHNGSAEDAAPHSHDLNGSPVPIDPVIEYFADAVAPAGSIWSTVLDMANYLRMELRNGLNDTGERIVSKENLLARRQPGIKIDDKSSYGLGLFLSQPQGIDEIGHGGNTMGFTSEMLFLPKYGIGMSVLINLRAANYLSLALHQRLLELLFGAENKADAIIASTATSLAKALERIRQRVKTDPAEIGWIENLIGDYQCEELGPAQISRKEGGYRIEFESWSSDLGAEEQSSDSRQVVLISPPWKGDFRLQVSPENRMLTIDGGQTKYEFVRTS